MSLLQILHAHHKFLRRMTEANPSLDNRLCNTSQKCCEYVLKRSWKHVNKNSLTWWYVLKASLRHLCIMSWRCLVKIFWKPLEDVLKTYDQDKYISLDSKKNWIIYFMIFCSWCNDLIYLWFLFDYHIYIYIIYIYI